MSNAFGWLMQTLNYIGRTNEIHLYTDTDIFISCLMMG